MFFGDPCLVEKAKQESTSSEMGAGASAASLSRSIRGFEHWNSNEGCGRYLVADRLTRRQARRLCKVMKIKWTAWHEDLFDDLTDGRKRTITRTQVLWAIRAEKRISEEPAGAAGAAPRNGYQDPTHSSGQKKAAPRRRIRRRQFSMFVSQWEIQIPRKGASRPPR